MDPNEDKSKSKRTFVLGVVDTSGMKATCPSRKRRWDQPPEEEGEEPDGTAPAKVVVTETVAPRDEFDKHEESFEDEMQDVFFDTSDTVFEEVLEENIETDSEPVPTSAPQSQSGDFANAESFKEASASAPGDPENVITTSASDVELKLPSHKDEDYVEIPSQVDTKDETIKEMRQKDKAETKNVAQVIFSDDTFKDTSSKSHGKAEAKTVAPVKISDSLKAIQFCYDEDDSSNSEESDNEGGTAVIAAAPKTDDSIKHVEGTSVLDEDLITKSTMDTVTDQGSIKLKDAPVPVPGNKSDTLEKSRSPTPVLADEPEGDPAQLTAGKVDELSTLDFVDEQLVAIDEPAIVTDETSKILIPEQSETPQPEGSVLESVALENFQSDAANIVEDVVNELTFDVNDQRILEESMSPEASETDATVRGLEKLVDSNNSSEMSEASKIIVGPSSDEKPVDPKPNRLTSMDNSQNCCVSFDDMSSLDKTSGKSPELDLRYSDSEEPNDVKNSEPEITMHFASVRTPSSIQTPESSLQEPEELEDESALAIDALINANPELEDKSLGYGDQTTQSQTTMEMLDSLVRRSSEDDPSRLAGGGGLFSEDSLIREINQLPDQDDSRNQESRSQSGAAKSSSKIVEIPQSNVSNAAADVCDPAEKPSLSFPLQELHKSETCTSVEEELSQGADEVSKNVTVSSANILEVIFGSESKSESYPTINAAADGESQVQKKIEEKPPKEGKDEPKTGQAVQDSKLQLNNDDFEMGSAEIVAVDPTKSLSGEDSDEEELAETKMTEDVSKTVEQPQELKQDRPAESIQVENEPESVQHKEEPKMIMRIKMKDILPPASVSKEKKPASKPSTVEPDLEMDVDESSASNDENTAASVPMDVGDDSEDTDKSSSSANERAPCSEVKEPVPVLIIKKQSFLSKKVGETAETLLTCSPKSSESSSGISSPSRKPPNESLHVDTVQEAAAETSSPRHSPITLRIYKDNLTVKTDLDSPKRNKSPLSSDFKSELSPRPGVPDNVSPQNKQLEFTLKIAKDVNTNQPKATMSPKHVASPTSVWKSEVHVDAPVEKPLRPAPAASAGKQPRIGPGAAGKQPPAAPVVPAVSTIEPLETIPVKSEKDVHAPFDTSEEKLSSVEERPEIETVIKPTRGRGRGRGNTARRAPSGRGRRGGAVGQRTKVDEPVVTPDEDASQVKIKQEVEEISSSSTPSLGLQMTDAFKKMMSQEKAALPQPDSLPPPPQTPTAPEVVTPVVKKRGRPRKSVQQVLPVPEEMVTIKTEPADATGADASGGETAEDTPTGRPKRTCRGRTKPIVIKKKRGGAAGSAVPRAAVTPVPVDSTEIKHEGTPLAATTSTPVSGTPDAPAPGGTGTAPDAAPASAPAPTPSARGRGNFKRPTPDRNTLSEKELAELQKIEARKEKIRLDRIAKYEAKKAKKLAKKLKDEERRKRQALEKAEKAAAAAPQVFEEETRMSAPDSSSRGHTPAPNRIMMTGDTTMGDESQNSITTPGDSNRGNKKGRMEISIGDLDCLVKEVKVDDLAEYQWQGSELYMIQEQVSLYLGVKSFKRKYPGLKRRTIEAEERTFLEDSGLVPKSMCDLGITAVSSSEILDIMYQDFPEKYEEFRKHVRDKQAREASYKQKAAIGLQKKDGTKVEPREQALEAVAAWNANLNRERKEERKCALDLQTFTVHYPKVHREHISKPTPKVGLYPVAVIPGQFCDFYKKYTPNELMYFPINTVLYGPLKPNERQKDGSDESGSESSSSSSSSSSSGESSSESESEGEDPPKCTMCNGTKKKNKDNLPEILLCCVQCKTCYHPSCKEFTPEMTPHLKYEWQCSACKQCAKCRDPNLKDRIMCCQLCDRGYHLSCIGLKKMPEGRWHCSVCAYCSSCDSRNPGGSDWQHEFKKGEKGTKVYQRTLCTPCFKLWRKGKYCQLCSKCHSMKPEEDPNLIQCNSCDRWLHKDCYGNKYGIQNQLLSTSSIQCDICVDRIQNSSISGPNRSLIKV